MLKKTYFLKGKKFGILLPTVKGFPFPTFQTVLSTLIFILGKIRQKDLPKGFPNTNKVRKAAFLNENMRAREGIYVHLPLITQKNQWQ